MFPLRRWEEIIKASSPTDYAVLLKYKQMFFRNGTARDEWQREVVPAPQYISTISPKKNISRFVSLPHYTFFKEWDIPLRAYEKMQGGSEVSVTHAVVEL